MQWSLEIETNHKPQTRNIYFRMFYPIEIVETCFKLILSVSNFKKCTLCNRVDLKHMFCGLSFKSLFLY